MSRASKLTISLLVVVIIALSFGVGFSFGRRSAIGPGQGLEVVGQAWNLLRADYVDPSRVNTENMSQAAIQGMIQSLDDPYTSYLPKEYYEMGISSLEGSFNGIGAYINVKDKQLVVIAPIAGSPAEKAGIKAGDIILEVNGEPVSGMNAAEAIIKIRGPQGTTVKLLVLHGENQPVLIEVTRTKVEVPSVRSEMRGNILYLKITEFSARTGEEISPVMRGLSSENATGIILDLRGNPGGLLDSVVDVASYFLKDGDIVSVRDNQGNISTLSVKPGYPTTDLPTVVLTDNASASGSEVLAGALQDRNRATIAGTRTYGKGSVNILRRLEDGSGLYITTGRWLTPDGRLIEGQGIEPDIKLDLTGDEAISWAANYLVGQK